MVVLFVDNERELPQAGVGGPLLSAGPVNIMIELQLLLNLVKRGSYE